MEDSNARPEEIVKDIRQLMEKSSRFLSLSGWSGIAAGICALTGAFIVSQKLGSWELKDYLSGNLLQKNTGIESQLYLVAAGTFVLAFMTAFFFTWLRSKKTNIPLWGLTARRLMWAVALPILTGAVFLFRMNQLEQYELIAPGCLIFYGLALLNASKFTLAEIRWLGYGELLLGFINCWFTGYGLYFWAAGFGVLHIVYGIVMWFRYEKEK